MNDWEIDMLETFDCEVQVRKWWIFAYASWSHAIGLSGRCFIIGPWMIMLP